MSFSSCSLTWYLFEAAAVHAGALWLISWAWMNYSSVNSCDRECRPPEDPYTGSNSPGERKTEGGGGGAEAEAHTLREIKARFTISAYFLQSNPCVCTLIGAKKITHQDKWEMSPNACRMKMF